MLSKNGGRGLFVKSTHVRDRLDDTKEGNECIWLFAIEILDKCGDD
jgi:hypothetical protein